MHRFKAYPTCISIKPTLEIIRISYQLGLPEILNGCGICCFMLDIITYPHADINGGFVKIPVKVYYG